MKVLVSCGPGFEPLDEVRRLTNFSTGELGVTLSNHLAQAGFEVLCLKGSGATHPDPVTACATLPFSTNDELKEHLEQIARTEDITALFHTAALCDFKVQRINDSSGNPVGSAKVSSRAGPLVLELVPATKVIGGLRHLFPRSLLVGWKFELMGAPAEAVARARNQIEENRLDACVLNGRAYGPGFGFCRAGGGLEHIATKIELARFLVNWLRGTATA